MIKEVKMTPAEEEQYRQDRIKEWRDRALDNVETIIESGAVDDEEVVVCDTLCNLMHWCNERQIDWDENMRVAKMHFDAEVAGIE